MIARLAVAALAGVAILLSIWQMEQAKSGLVIERMTADQTPVTVYRSTDTVVAPVVVIAHGFAGSRQLMEPFAVTLAQSGLVAVSFDFLGHGANRAPLTGDVTKEEGATKALLAELTRVIGWARSHPDSDGRVAVLGHSMASDIIVRAAVSDPEIEATVAVSMFTREVTAEAPANLLMIIGEWEGFLAREALRTLEVTVPDPTYEVTYGTFADGSARRATLAGNVEHVGVLYSPDSLQVASAWLNATFGNTGTGPIDARGPWVLLLIAGVVTLAWPLAHLLPRVDRNAAPEAVRPWRQIGIAALPAIATPLILWPLPTDFLPVLVADYLVLHFTVYGGITLAILAWMGRLSMTRPTGALVGAIVAVALYGIFAMGFALDTYAASFLPHPGRVELIAALAAGATLYTLADEWYVRRTGARWWVGPLTKVFFILSLAAAVALDLDDLFFLAIITPVILLFFIIYGLFAHWAYGATRHPSVAGVANGLAFGWALGVTFPLLAS